MPKKSHPSRLLFVFAILGAVLITHVVQGEDALVSTMRNVKAVGEARGYRLRPATDIPERVDPNYLAPIMSFEIQTPRPAAVTLGRLYTSCSCVQLVASQKTFAAGEQVVLELRNVRPTPPAGQIYALYVQVTSPIRATLRYDTFLKSSQFIHPEPPTDNSANLAVEENRNNDLEEYLAKSPTTEDAFRALERERDPEAAAAAVAALSEQEATPAIIEPEAPVAIPEPEAPLAAPPPEVEVIIPENTFPEADPEEDLPQAIVEREAEPAVTPISEPVAPTPAPQAPAVEQEAKLVDQRLSLITLGVTDLTRSRQFYEAVGWKQVARNKYDSIVFFQLNGMVLSLYPLNDLLSDQNLNGLATVPGGITLGINTRTKEEVNAYYQLFLSVGGKSLKAPDEMPWGAVTCYVADPDGHPWEISWVPQMQVDNDGDLWLR